MVHAERPGAGRIRKILLATDFSETACLAQDWAASIAAAHGAALHLVHAMFPARPPAPAPEFVLLPLAEHQQLEAALRQRLEETRAALEHSQVTAHTDLRIGPASATLLDSIAEHQPDLVVVGTRGLTGFKRLVLGSTAARVVRDSRAPVLTIHPSDASRARRLRTVLVATDFSEEAARASAMALTLAHATPEPTRLVLAHAYRLAPEFDALGSTPVADGLEHAREQAGRRLAELAGPLEAPGREVVCAARRGHPADVIDVLAREHDVDLVALGTRGLSGVQRLFFGSTAERVLPHAPCPVLTVSGPED